MNARRCEKNDYIEFLRDFRRRVLRLTAMPATCIRPWTDGRVWFYRNVRNYWTNASSRDASDWFSVDLGEPQAVN